MRTRYNMETTIWDKLLKENDKITITFSLDMYNVLRKTLGVTSYVCTYCSKRITKKNIGAFLGKNRICCKNSFCLIKYIREGENENGNRK